MSNFLINSSIFIHLATDTKIFLVFCIAIGIVLIYKKQLNYLKIFATIIATTSTLVVLLKNIFKIERPENAILQLNDYAFPSGHAALSFALLTFILFYIFRENKKVATRNICAIIFTIFSIIISGSRIVLDVHTIWQSIAGAVLGLVVALSVIYIFYKK